MKIIENFEKISLLSTSLKNSKIFKFEVFTKLKFIKFSNLEFFKTFD